MGNVTTGVALQPRLRHKHPSATATARNDGAGDCGLRTTDYGLRTMDYGLWTMDYGLWTMVYGL
ncbi:hypothetical protein JHW43_000211 [Diplocarpon mali]|nr:hypothetical protein JHW43_000211 [Diplocarpon mali]